jgi:hypothetical protein
LLGIWLGPFKRVKGVDRVRRCPCWIVSQKTLQLLSESNASVNVLDSQEAKLTILVEGIASDPSPGHNEEGPKKH